MSRKLRTLVEVAALMEPYDVVEIVPEVEPACPVDKDCPWRGVAHFDLPTAGEEARDWRLEMEHIVTAHPEVLVDPPEGKLFNREFWKTSHTTGRVRLTVTKSDQAPVVEGTKRISPTFSEMPVHVTIADGTVGMRRGE